ncbi:MAG TPA: hypothetical protein EYQ63_22340 [Fuerstia sp.]|nr:hypothetical protein [Fuerstiella sp.]
MSNPTRLIRIIVGILLLSTAGYGTSQSTPVTQEVAGVSSRQTVEQFGGMREVMREGKTKSRIRLIDAIATPHTFAVGALEGLSGEVTIVDGNVWVSRVSVDGELEVNGPEPAEEDSATLLTLGHVSRWHRTTIETAASGNDLESLIEQFARTKGLDTSKPFPFRIAGELVKIDLHVINGYCPIATDPSTKEKKPWRWANSETVNVDLTGFYAPNSVAVMTHHGTSIHAHAIVMVDDTRIMGHVDGVTVEPGMTLFVPSL